MKGQAEENMQDKRRRPRNYRDLKLFAVLSALTGLIICMIIPVKLMIGIEIAEVTSGMEVGARSFIELVPLMVQAEKISLIYKIAYLIFILLLLCWIFIAYSNLINYQAARSTRRNDDRRIRRWPWQSCRRVVFSSSKNVLARPRPAAGKRFPLTESPAFAIAGFFIPLWFFYHPYFIITKLWAGSADDNSRARARTRLVGVLWLLSNPLFGCIPLIGYQLIMWLRWGHFYTPQIWPPVPDALSSLIFIPYTCWLSFRIHKMQKAKLENATVG
ncbi:MAG TPA: hypothetical protein PKA10_01660 [Selenomonadales bacterium]|nr:hypothetical protein [Selenomonadales bacterium]